MVCADESARGEKTPREVRPIITSAEIIQAIKTTEIQGSKEITQIWSLDGQLISMDKKEFDDIPNITTFINHKKRGEQNATSNRNTKSESGG